MRLNVHQLPNTKGMSLTSLELTTLYYPTYFCLFLFVQGWTL